MFDDLKAQFQEMISEINKEVNQQMLKQDVIEESLP